MRKNNFLGIFLSLLILSDCSNLRNLTEKKATLEEMGIVMPEILLPKNIDVKTWATISCDQYTQDRGYWEQVNKIVGNNPSTAKITFPEVYLNDPRKE